MPSPVVAAVITSIAGVGSDISQQKQEKKRMNSMLTAQDEATKRAEAKAKKAEEMAKENALLTARNRRKALTKTILTSPLGITEQANVKMPTLFGGS